MGDNTETNTDFIAEYLFKTEIGQIRKKYWKPPKIQIYPSSDGVLGCLHTLHFCDARPQTAPIHLPIRLQTLFLHEPLVFLSCQLNQIYKSDPQAHPAVATHVQTGNPMLP